MVEHDDEHAGEAAHASVRRLVRIVLACHFAELAELGDQWPPCSPADAVLDLGAGECSVLEHVEAVADRVLQQLGRAPVRH